MNSRGVGPDPRRTASVGAADVDEGGGAAQLHSVLGSFDGIAIVIGTVIGAGILRTPGLIAGYLGDPGLILAVWVLGGVYTALTALVLAELGSMMPAAGGKYAYVREAYGGAAGAFAGWGEILLTRSFSGALKAVLLGEYVVMLMGGHGSPRVVAGVFSIGFVLLHARGVGVGRAFQNATTLLKVTLLVAVVTAGLLFGDGESWRSSGTLSSSHGLLLGIALASQSVFFTYYGAEASLQVSEEFRDPARSVPRVLLYGVGTVTLLYLLINFSFLNVLGPAEMAGSQLVARDVLSKVLGEWGGTAVALVAVGVLLSSLNYNFFGAPRVPFGLARDGLAPRVLTSVNTGGTPTAALYMTGALIFVLAVSGTFEILIRFTSFLTLVIDVVVLTTIFILRRREPERRRPFRVPFYPLLPGAAVAIYVALIVLIAISQPRLAFGGMVMLAAIAIGARIGARVGDPKRAG